MLVREFVIVAHRLAHAASAKGPGHVHLAGDHVSPEALGRLPVLGPAGLGEGVDDPAGQEGDVYRVPGNLLHLQGPDVLNEMAGQFQVARLAGDPVQLDQGHLDDRMRGPHLGTARQEHGAHVVGYPPGIRCPDA